MAKKGNDSQARRLYRGLKRERDGKGTHRDVGGIVGESVDVGLRGGVDEVGLRGRAGHGDGFQLDGVVS